MHVAVGRSRKNKESRRRRSELSLNKFIYSGLTTFRDPLRDSSSGCKGIAKQYVIISVKQQTN